MAQYAVLIYCSDSAHAPEASADTSAEVATCDQHADQLASAAVMTADPGAGGTSSNGFALP